MAARRLLPPEPRPRRRVPLRVNAASRTSLKGMRIVYRYWLNAGRDARLANCKRKGFTG
jgi:hypothetical protein